MAILKIARMGHPVLLRRAEPVADPRDPEIRRLAEDMVETMLDAGGVGLAAPQVHVPLRLFVVREWEGGRALINPELEPLGEEVESGWEGCLSIPGLRGCVPRAKRVRWRAQDLDGREIGGEAEGMSARVLQHEYDHLEGTLYTMRMPDLTLLGFEQELARAAAERRKAEEAEPAS
ncbi:peptide deformylase [Roseomonas gilardii]|uniref:Peptide deformylase n=1 Tax=Roseomonas gilardii TaxID=257708 RepID=A0A1L7ADH6_9PROT|nr:peptide deformylase [Roseomonas gilardii]APT56803.1 peptide deformylase [Roseomonas gilardii]MDT8329639.1 peptide deformylase [Roseomonas gilardii]PZR11364.1 MAG: peptide deformylase [Azospirillum brasilense]